MRSIWPFFGSSWPFICILCPNLVQFFKESFHDYKWLLLPGIHSKKRKKAKKGYFMQECGGSSLKTTKNDNHGYQIGLGKFRIIAKKVSLSLRQFFPSVHECLKITQKVSFYNIYFREQNQINLNFRTKDYSTSSKFGKLAKQTE